jgi:uncharacterized protein YraI
MDSKYGFTRMTVDEFEQWITGQRVGRTIDRIQQHHTYSPSYQHFNGSNHFEKQKAMKDYHVVHNGWSDIAQHFTIFPDGMIVTGRSPESIPAGIKGQNATGICIENFGNFDQGKDQMTQQHKDAIVAVTAALLKKFSLNANTRTVIYHHWYDLTTGERNDGTKNNKSCPGTAFFGGNKPPACEQGFLPLVSAKMGAAPNPATGAVVLRYAGVTAASLNVRTGPGSQYPKADGREPLELGAIIRVYAEQGGWLKISSSADHWVSGNYTIPVKKGEVITDSLNVRTGPGTAFPKSGTFMMGDEVFVFEEKDGWSKVILPDKWVSSKYLRFS